MTEIDRLIDILAEELNRQGRDRGLVPGAPLVLDHRGGDFILVYGRLNLRQLALVLIARGRP